MPLYYTKERDCPSSLIILWPKNKFGNAKRLIHTCPGVKFGLYYPAELRITLPGGTLRRFTDHAAAADFINKNLRRADGNDGAETQPVTDIGILSH